MSGGWRDATYAETIEQQARDFFWPRDAKLQHDCDCERGPCRNAPEGAINGRRVSLCPYGQQRSWWFRLIVDVVAALDAGAVSGWPDRYACGIVEGVHRFRAVREQWRADQIEKASRR